MWCHDMLLEHIINYLGMANRCCNLFPDSTLWKTVTLETTVFDLCACTSLALHMTTPVKSTATAFCNYVLFCRMTTPTTHQITTVNSDRSGIALTSKRALKSNTIILFAKRWWILKVDKIASTWFLMVDVYGIEVEPPSPPTTTTTFVPCKWKCQNKTLWHIQLTCCNIFHLQRTYSHFVFRSNFLASDQW